MAEHDDRVIAIGPDHVVLPRDMAHKMMVAYYMLEAGNLVPVDGGEDVVLDDEDDVGDEHGERVTLHGDYEE